MQISKKKTKNMIKKSEESTYASILFYICRSEVYICSTMSFNVSEEVHHSHILGLLVMYSIH